MDEATCEKNPFNRRFAFFLLPQKLKRHVLEIEFHARVRKTQPWTLRLRRRCDTSSSDDDNLDLGCRRSKKQLRPVHVSCSCSKTTQLGPLCCSCGVQPIALYPIPPKTITFQLNFKCNFAPWNAKPDLSIKNTFSLTERRLVTLRSKNYGFHHQLVRQT
jgi:hypothetical protein